MRAALDAVEGGCVFALDLSWEFATFPAMRDRIHAIITVHLDLVVFVPSTDGKSSLIIGAERSMGRSWRDGSHPIESCRRLWREILGLGGIPVPRNTLDALLKPLVSDLQESVESARNALNRAERENAELTRESKTMMEMIDFTHTYGSKHRYPNKMTSYSEYPPYYPDFEILD